MKNAMSYKSWFLFHWDCIKLPEASVFKSQALLMHKLNRITIFQHYTGADASLPFTYTPARRTFRSPSLCL